MIFENIEIKHGTPNEYNKGCRCDKCKKAKSDYRTNTPIVGHGTKWYYDKGCRCDSCINAKVAYRRKSHPIVEGRVTTDLVKGTRICYSCHKEKPLGEFGRNKNRRASMGRSHQCRVCQNERSRRNKNTPEHRFSTYVSSARVRGIQFLLSFEQFMTFWCKPCYYCDDPIDGIGLDRIDSKGGYSIENVLPCCSKCNRMKTILTTDEFISMCLKIAKKFENHIVAPTT